jgi:GNAT superfamily N-acetyltransferase
MTDEQQRQLIELYDQDQRINVTYPQMRREILPGIIRLIHEAAGGSGTIIYSDFSADEADRFIKDQIDYFEKLGQDFEWKVYNHDRPNDLKERLVYHGFEIEEAEAIMVMPIANAAAPLLAPVTHEVEKITNADQFSLIQQIEDAVWGVDHGGLVQELRSLFTNYPSTISLYVAYVDKIPAACAWSFFLPGSQFASLWGGSTLPEYRGRGLYTALVATRTQEAARQGRRYLTVDAGPMSRPIMGKYGFQVIDLSYPCNWSVNK